MEQFQESLELLKRMNTLSGGKGENEYNLLEAKGEDAADFEKGVVRKVKFGFANRKLKLSYAGKIEYIDLPNNLLTKKDVFSFLVGLFNKLNKAIFPVKLEHVGTEEEMTKKEKASEEEEE